MNREIQLVDGFYFIYDIENEMYVGSLVLMFCYNICFYSNRFLEAEPFDYIFPLNRIDTLIESVYIGNAK